MNTLYLPLKPSQNRCRELCDWRGCGRPWMRMFPKGTTAVNPKEGVKVCKRHGFFLESLDAKVRRMRGLPPKSRKTQKFGVDDVHEV